jgi:hypothetical protein
VVHAPDKFLDNKNFIGTSLQFFINEKLQGRRNNVFRCEVPGRSPSAPCRILAIGKDLGIIRLQVIAGELMSYKETVLGVDIFM